MTKQVRIEGDPAAWEVLFESEATLILVNRRVRHEQEIAALERQLADAHRRLEVARAPGDVSP
jgi:hypothetical protein